MHESYKVKITLSTFLVDKSKAMFGLAVCKFLPSRVSLLSSKIVFFNSPLEKYSDLGRREVDEFENASTPSRKRATSEEGNNSIFYMSCLSEIHRDVFCFPHIFSIFR